MYMLKSVFRFMKDEQNDKKNSILNQNLRLKTFNIYSCI